MAAPSSRSSSQRAPAAAGRASRWAGPVPALLAAFALLAALALAAPAGAATFTVDTLDDSGDGSLRSAIDDANATPEEDRIVFEEDMDETLKLESPLPTITSPVSVRGPGPSKLTLSGDDSTGILTISLPTIGQVRVSELSMRGGLAADGGAISSFGSDLVLHHTVISENEATNSGGAISVSEGSLTLRNALLRDNSAAYSGGAVHLYNAGMTMVHSEIASSTAGGSGGGIGVANPIGPLAIERSQVLENGAAGNGGGISVTGGPTQPLTIARSGVIGSDVAGDGGGVSTVGSLQPVMIHVKVEDNTSSGRGPDVFPPMLDPAQTAPPAPQTKAAAKEGDGKKTNPGSLPPATVEGPPVASSPSPATLLGGVAFAPPDAPTRVKAVIDAANFISRTPYVFGGGHASFYSRGYDCSGAVSFALFGGGFLGAPLASGAFERWGEPGPGKWITVYANPGHAFAVVADRRWDTSGDARGSGPRWHLETASAAGYVARHPAGY